MEYPARVVTACSILLLVFAGSLCKPGTRFLLFPDCDEVFNCTGIDSPVCGTDQQTYPSNCTLTETNMNNFCTLGLFNPLKYVHSGPCKPQHGHHG